MVDREIEIKLTAIDEASDVVAAASKKISADVDEVSRSQNELSARVEASLPPLSDSEQATKKSDVSMRSLTTGISGVATASFSLYGAYDRVNESEISLDRANLMVKSSAKGVEDAERALSKAVLEHGAGSDEASRASDSLSIAQDRLTLANERAQQAQENVNKSMLSAALQIIPTSITMVDSLSEAWNNFPDLTASFSRLKDKISDVGGGVEGLGTKLKGLNGISFAPLIGALSAVVVAAVDAKYSIDQTNYEKSVYKAEHGQNTEMPWYEQAYDYFKNFEIGAPMVISDYVISALGGSKPTVEQQASINKFMKGEISKDELLEKFKNVPQLAKGGIIDHATFALVGEETPEIVMPLSQYESQRRESSKTQADAPRQIVTVDVGGLHFYGDIADSKFLEKAAEYTADKISDAVNLRR